jgi:Effector Associated Constant Component 1
VDVLLSLDDADRDDLTSLLRWLNDEDSLRGTIELTPRHTPDGRLGVPVELLTVALGGGGAGSVLASSLKTWLQNHRTSVKLTVKAKGRTIVLELNNISKAETLLRAILRDTDDA